jgi:GR25 family glycosyltransferase involved in LPS biosynthesis
MKRITLFLIILFILIALIFIYFCSKKETTFEKINNIKNELEQLVKEIDIYNSLYPRKQMITIPVYYINMDKSKDRNEWMIQQLSKNVDRYYRVSAVNGYSIQNKEHDIVDGVEFYNDFKELTLPEIGCTLSHLKAIHTAYENGENIAIIMEDDVYVDMINLLDDSVEELVKNAPEEWEILQLVYLEKKLNKSLKTFNRYSYHQHLRGNYESFTSSYLINRKGMENILKRLGKNPYYLDMNTSDSGVSDCIIYDNATTFIIEPSIVTPYNLKIESTIHTDHTILHLEKSLNILKNYKSKLSSTKKKKQLKDMISNLALYNKKVGFKCDIPCPVYYINMDKDIDRRRFMEQQIEKMPNVSFTRVSGFNGHAIRNKKNDIIKYDDGFIKFINKFDEMSTSEIGCTMSHLIAIKKAYTNGDKIAMICEDDILFDTCMLIKPIQEMINEAPKNWEILQLCSFTEKEVHEQSKNHPEIDYIRNNGKNRHYNTACYLINRNGMENILRFSSTDNFFIINKKLDFPSNGTADIYIYEICVTYTVLPVPFTVDNTYNDSTIHTSHTDDHIISSINTLSKFKIINFPKVIYICDKTFEFIEKYSQNWKRLNPEYEVVLFDNKACEEFLETEFSPLHLEIFRYIPDGPIKADFWRLCILYKNGGVYTDADNEPLIPLRDFIEDVDFVTCSSYWDKTDYKFNPNFIVTKAGDKILEDSINLYIHWYKTKKPYNYWDWSIMQVFTEILKINNKEGIYNVNDKKIQIIREVKGKNHHDDHNIYKGIRVFNNRYKNYDADTHSFLK